MEHCCGRSRISVAEEKMPFLEEQRASIRLRSTQAKQVLCTFNLYYGITGDCIVNLSNELFYAIILFTSTGIYCIRLPNGSAFE